MKHGLKSPAIIFFFSIIGIIISFYLTVQHYAPSSSSFCDFGEHVSCSLVNKSVYSEIFGIPVALLGIFWFAAASLLSFGAIKKVKKAVPALRLWSSIGASFILYLIYVEWTLQAVCPFCLVVQMIVLLMLILSFSMHQKQ